MRGFRANAVLGKCTFCGFRIKEDDTSTSAKFAKISFGRWICGGCLFGMKDAVDAVGEALDEGPQVKTYEPRFDPKLGKYVSDE